MAHWQKLGLLFSPQVSQERWWMKSFAQAPATLIFDDFVRVYFSSRPNPAENGQYVSYSGYLDLDRRDLRTIKSIGSEPILQLGGLGQFDEFGTYPVSVIKHGNEFRCYYAGWTRCESVPFNVSIGLAMSTDNGVTFQKIGPGPILPFSVDEPFVLSGPKIRHFNNKWYLFYIAGKKWKLVDGKPEPVYRIRMATSDNGISWTRTNRDVITTKLEDDEAQASPDVTFHDGIYHMFFCYRYSTNFRSKEFGYRIGYASSADLIHWHRDDSKAGIDVSPSGWDSEMISYPHVLAVDGTVYLLYLGNDVGKFGFGLAKLVGNLGDSAEPTL